MNLTKEQIEQTQECAIGFVRRGVIRNYELRASTVVALCDLALRAARAEEALKELVRIEMLRRIRRDVNGNLPFGAERDINNNWFPAVEVARKAIEDSPPGATSG